MSKEEILKNIINSYCRKQTPPFSMEEYALIQYEKFCLQLIQENKQLKEELDRYKEAIAKFKDLKTLIGILNNNNLRFSFNEILQELKGSDKE